MKLGQLIGGEFFQRDCPSKIMFSHEVAQIIPS